MFFTIKNKKYLSTQQLKANTLLDAYFMIKNYPMSASEKILDQYIQQQYKITLKNLCIKLLLDLTHYSVDERNLVLLFKHPENDKLAQLVTFGNGAIMGSRILKIALKDY